MPIGCLERGGKRRLGGEKKTTYAEVAEGEILDYLLANQWSGLN